MTFNNTQSGFFTLLLATAVLVMPVSSVFAEPGKIKGPHVTKGEKGIEVNSTYGFDYDDSEDELGVEAELEYGLTDQVLLKVDVEFENNSGHITDVGGFGAALRYEFAEPGVLPVDAALQIGYQFSGTGGADSVGLKLLLQKEWGSYRLRSNIELEHELGEKSEDGLGLEIAVGGYTTFSDWKVGIEYFADIGNLKEQSGYSDQRHFIGPIVGSEFHVSPGVELEYTVGYFQGISHAAEDGTVKVELGLKY